MAINLATQYSDKILSIYTASSFFRGKVNTEFKFTGVKGIEVATPITVPLVDYKRSGEKRMGELHEMQDMVQLMELTQDKAFYISIDKGNNLEQKNIKEAGKMLTLQITEQNVPTIDKYCLKRWIETAGKIVSVPAPSKTTAINLVADAAVAFDEKLIPQSERYLAVPPTLYNYIRLSDDFIKVDGLNKKALSEGIIGTVLGFNVIKIPSSYFPDNAYFYAWHKKSIIQPTTISDAKFFNDVAGMSGSLLQGRDRFDAFTLGTLADGTYSAVKTDCVVVKPTVTIASNSATLASTTTGTTIKYTLDGTDPRYSKQAMTYGSAVTLTAKQTIKCYAFKDGLFDSEVVSGTNA